MAVDPVLRDMFDRPVTLSGRPVRAARTRPRRPVVAFPGVDDPAGKLPPCNCTKNRLKSCVRHNPNRIRRMPPITLEPAGPLRLVLPFDRPPITANEARSKQHWRAQHAAKQRVHDTIADAIEIQDALPVFARCAVELTWHAHDRGRRDPDSLAPFLKACLDGLKLAGVIEDDHAGVVDYVAMRIKLASPPPRMVLRVLPA